MEPREYIFFKQRVSKLLKIDLNNYKSTQVQRRIKNYLLRSGYSSWPTYFRMMENDPAEMSKLKDYLTINVSAFFRDPKKFVYLQETVLPMLLHGNPKLHIWSAGCSRGHEPFSMAIMLAQTTSLYRNHHILATDIDQSALNYVEKGGPYSSDDLINVSPKMLDNYFKQDGKNSYVTESIRKKITIQSHNLLDDHFESGFDLIICRNVVIYFTAEAKTLLYKKFYDALRPGGIFFVGGTEIITKSTEMGFESLGHSFYRRKGED